MEVKYREGTSVTDHLSQMQGIMDQLLGMYIKFDDEVLAYVGLASLPEA